MTIPFEVQEAVAFMDGVEAAFSDLEPVLLDRDPAAVERIKSAYAELRADVDDAQQSISVAPQEELDAARDRAAETFERIAPQEWTEAERRSRLRTRRHLPRPARSGGRRRPLPGGRAGAARRLRLLRVRAGAEAARLRPAAGARNRGTDLVRRQRRRRARQPGRRDAPLSEIRETRLDLDEKLDDARALTGDGASAMTAITNSALIVFREGLEAILILAAITASMIGPRAPLRRPIYRGALLALPASMVMFVLALLLLDSLSQYGEKLEAVVGVVAIGVLLLVMNWFFHRVYWTEWIKGHRDRGKALTGAALAAGRERRPSPASTRSASPASSARASRPSSSCRRCSSAPAPASSSPASRSAWRSPRRRRRSPSRSSASSPTRRC